MGYYRAIKWAIKWEFTTGRSGSKRIRADFWRASGESARCNFPADSSGPTVDSTRVHCGPQNRWRICRGSATSTRQSSGLICHERQFQSAGLGELVFAVEKCPPGGRPAADSPKLFTADPLQNSPWQTFWEYWVLPRSAVAVPQQILFRGPNTV